VEHAGQLLARHESLLDVLGAAPSTVARSGLVEAETALRDGDAERALRLADEARSAARSAWGLARAERLTRERLARLPLALGLAAPFGLYWWLTRRRVAWSAPLVGALAYFGLVNTLYFVVGGNWLSPSLINNDPDVERFFAARVYEAVAALALAVLAVALWRRWDGSAAVARHAVHVLFLVALGLAAQVLLFYVLWGMFFAWALPDLALAMKCYLDLFQSLAFWPRPWLPVAPGLPLAAVGLAWLARRLEGALARWRAPTVRPIGGV
jgi:hypothetical protein